jgi:hypothetical protein
MPKKKTKPAPRIPKAPEPKADVESALASLEALKVSGVGRAFDPADLDPIIALLKG